MQRLIRFILTRISDDNLKAELRRRGYATDISITFMSGSGEPKEFSGIGKGL